MSLGHRELTDVVGELAVVLPGSRLEKLNSPSGSDCQMVLRGKGQNRLLLIDLEPGRTRMHLIEDKLPAPPRPPGWVMKCREEIGAAFLSAVSVVGDDRIVRLDFERPRSAPRSLLAELFGRSGRLLLLDEEQVVILPLIGRATPGVTYVAPRPGGSPSAKSRFGDPDPASLAVNRAVATHYGAIRERGEIEARLRQLARFSRREVKKASGLLKKLETDLAKGAAAGELSRKAEALKSQLASVKRGMKSVELTDYADPAGGKLRVELDPALSAVENMEKMFKKIGRMKRARPKIEDRLRKTNRRLEDLRALRDELERVTEMETLDELSARAGQLGFSEKTAGRRTAAARRLPFRAYQSAAGLKIMVGRSSVDNQRLTFQLAKGSDLWFHARNRPGAHVVVRLGRGEEIDEQTLLDAASLAAVAAGAKPGDRVEVAYTRVKNLHPVKGQPGRAAVSNERSILVHLEADRLERLRLSRKE